MPIPSRTKPGGVPTISAATIQPRFGEDAFPIGRFILDRAKDLGLSRTDLVRRLRYQNLGKGHNVLAELLKTGEVPLLATQNLTDAREVAPATLDAVMRATAQQQHDIARARVLAQEEAYRAAFRSHLQVQTDRRVPSPIFVAAVIGVARLRIIHLPDKAFSANQEERDQIVRAIIVEHFAKHRGQIPAFGAITGYLLVAVPGYGGVDFGVPYDVTGLPRGPICSVGRLPVATLGLNGDDTRLKGLSRTTFSLAAHRAQLDPDQTPGPRIDQSGTGSSPHYSRQESLQPPQSRETRRLRRHSSGDPRAAPRSP